MSAVSGGDVSLLGGGVISGNTLKTEALQEKEKLEQMLIEKNGFGEAERPMLIIG